MLHRVVHRRTSVGRVLACLLGAWILTGIPTAAQFSASPSFASSADRMRLNLAYAEQMRPAGLAALTGSSATTLTRLEHAPELERAVALAALDQDGTLPYHLKATFTLAGDAATSRTGTVQADRYNDRWSRLVVTLDGLRSSQWVVDGHRVTDDRLPAIPFGLQRLLRAIFHPLGDATLARVPITADTVAQDGLQLHCTVVGKQPALEIGMVPASRSLCVDTSTGDLRLDVAGYGFRTVFADFQTLGNHRVARHLQVLQNDKVIADMSLKLEVAGDLTPADFADDTRQASAILFHEPRFCWMARPSQMHNDLETLDVHIIPLDDTTLKQRPSLVVARTLIGTDGRVADIEVLGDANPQLRATALKVVRVASFHRREWKGQPVTVEGLLLLSSP